MYVKYSRVTGSWSAINRITRRGGAGMTAEKIAWSEIQMHNHRSSCWVVLQGKVYNLTTFMDDVSRLHNTFNIVHEHTYKSMNHNSLG